MILTKQHTTHLSISLSELVSPCFQLRHCLYFLCWVWLSIKERVMEKKEGNFILAVSFDKLGSEEHKNFQEFVSKSLKNDSLVSIKAFDNEIDLSCALDLVDKEFFMY